jgi:RHS repeat-associated protein
VKEVNRTNGSTKKNLKFRYDAMGQRVAKEVYDSNNNWEKTTYYVRDPQGNVMAIYDKTTDVQSQQISYKVTERDVYGSSRVGLNTIEVEMIGATTGGSISSHVVGKKQYEISNHLGNVLSIVTDKVLSKDWDLDNIVDYFRSEIVNASDYTPFGAAMPGRMSNASSSRYGYSGMEKVDEMHGNSGDSYDFGARMYDARLGRWLSVDPLATINAAWSTYCGMDDSPIALNDPDGKNAGITIDGNTITVSTTIHITGEGATAEKAAEMQAGIMQYWGAAPGTYTDEAGKVYNVKFDIKVEVMTPGDGTCCQNPENVNDNVVVLHDHDANGDYTSHVNYAGNIGNWGNNESAETYAHEVGHMFKLDDAYVNVQTAVMTNPNDPVTGIGPVYSINYPSVEAERPNELMGTGNQVTQQDVNAIASYGLANQTNGTATIGTDTRFMNGPTMEDAFWAEGGQANVQGYYVVPDDVE